MAPGDLAQFTAAAFMGVMIVMPALLIVRGPAFGRHAFGWVLAGAGLNAGFALLMPAFERGFYLVYTAMALIVGLIVLALAGAIASARAPTVEKSARRVQGED